MENTNENSSVKSLLNKKVISVILCVLSLVFTIIYYSIKLTSLIGKIPTNSELVDRGNFNLWTAKNVPLTSTSYIPALNVVFIVLFLLTVGLYLLSYFLYFTKNSAKPLFATTIFQVVVTLFALIFSMILKLFATGAIVCCIITLLIAAIHIVIVYTGNVAKARYGIDGASTDDVENDYTEPIVQLTPAQQKLYKLILFVLSCVALITAFVCLFVPLYKQTGISSSQNIPITAINGKGSTAITITFLVLLIALFGEVLYFITLVSDYQCSVKRFAVTAKKFVASTTVFTFIYFVAGYIVAFYYNTFAKPQIESTTITMFLPIISAVTLIVSSIFYGKLLGNKLPSKTLNGKRRLPTVEPLIFELLMTLITFASLFVVIISGTPKLASSSEFSYTGLQLITKYNDANAISGVSFFAFGIMAMLIVSGIMLLLSVTAFFANDKSYYRIVKLGAITNLVFMCLLGLLGFYFQIVSKAAISAAQNAINADYVEESLLLAMSQNQEFVNNYSEIISNEYFNQYIKDLSVQAAKQIQSDTSLTEAYEIKSQAIYLMIAAVGVVVAMIARGVFGLGSDNKSITEENELAAIAQELENSAATANAQSPSTDADEDDTPETVSVDGPIAVDIMEKGSSKFKPDFDACPAFTELDSNIPLFRSELEARKAKLFANPTLPAIVRFVVDYARDCRLHLSYSPEDMANFIAGLGASRLTILQGMSGTGKTSLPKIFTEAVMGKCEIVEVESSWRDKGELIGYYNEFSKSFTPKKFTQCLYRAKLNSKVLTLIVLDEMNLSRIEYYFSDFLSLMEHEEDKREIKLSNVKLHRTENGETYEYDGLTDGHTIKIPTNVWFIGTANRDESTFEISDKVYDRAQTMNFNKRAPKIYNFGEPLDQQFLPYDVLIALFNEAKATVNFDAEKNVAIQKTEKLLAPYNISFGNRILRQMEDFVKIYCACFGDKAAAEKDAVERILLSKVVSKLENKVVENREALAQEFDRIGLLRCGEFVRKLSED